MLHYDYLELLGYLYEDIEEPFDENSVHCPNKVIQDESARNEEQDFDNEEKNRFLQTSCSMRDLHMLETSCTAKYMYILLNYILLLCNTDAKDVVSVRKKYFAKF